jgi:hypothetical protein
MNKDEPKTMPVSEDVAARKEPNRPKSKSSAQVESFVEPQAVQRNSGGLKPSKSRPSHIGIRLTPQEREIVVQQAEKIGLTISEYARLTILKSPSLDPERHRLLLKLNLELTRQGTNLNQIAKQLNGKVVSPEQAESLLAMIARTMMQAHKAVHDALTNGRAEA